MLKPFYTSPYIILKLFGYIYIFFGRKIQEWLTNFLFPESGRKFLTPLRDIQHVPAAVADYVFVANGFFGTFFRINLLQSLSFQNNKLSLASVKTLVIYAYIWIAIQPNLFS